MPQERIVTARTAQLQGYEATQSSGVTTARVNPELASVAVPTEVAALTAPTIRTASGIHLVASANQEAPTILVAKGASQKDRRAPEAEREYQKENVHYSSRWEFYKEVAQHTELLHIIPCIQTIEANEKRIAQWSNLTTALMSSNENTFYQGLNLLAVINLGDSVSQFSVQVAWLGFLRSSKDSYIQAKISEYAQRINIPLEFIPARSKKPELVDFVERPQASARSLSRQFSYEEFEHLFAERSRVIDLGKNNGEQKVLQPAVVDSFFAEIIEMITVFEHDPLVIEMHLQRIKLLLSIFCHTLETVSLPYLKSTITALTKLADKLPIKKKVAVGTQGIAQEKEHDSFISYSLLWDLFLLIRCDSTALMEKVVEAIKKHGDIKHPLAVYLLSQLSTETSTVHEQTRIKEQLIELCTGTPDEVLLRFDELQKLQWQLATAYPMGTGSDLVGFDCEVWPFNNIGLPLFTHIDLDGGQSILEIKLDSCAPVLKYTSGWIQTAIECRNWQYLAQAPAASIHFHIDPPEIDYQRKLRVFKNMFGSTAGGATGDFWVNVLRNSVNPLQATFEVRTSLELYPVHQVSKGAVAFDDGFNSFALINFMLDAKNASLSSTYTPLNTELLERNDPLFSRFRHIVRLYDDPQVRLSALLLIHDHLGPRLRGYQEWNEDQYRELLDQNFGVAVAPVEDNEDPYSSIFDEQWSYHEKTRNLEFDFNSDDTYNFDYVSEEDEPDLEESSVRMYRSHQELAEERAHRSTERMIEQLHQASTNLQGLPQNTVYNEYARIILQFSEPQINWDVVLKSLHLTATTKDLLIASIFKSEDIYGLNMRSISWFLRQISTDASVSWDVVTTMAQNYARYSTHEYYSILLSACSTKLWKGQTAFVLSLFEKQLPDLKRDLEDHYFTKLLDVFVERLSDKDFYTTENRIKIKQLLQEAYSGFRIESDTYHFRSHVYRLIEKSSTKNRKLFPDVRDTYVLDEGRFTTAVLELYEVLNYNMYAISLTLERVLELPLSRDAKFLIVYTCLSNFNGSTLEENNMGVAGLRLSINSWDFTAQQFDQLSDALEHRAAILKLENSEFKALISYCKQFERKNLIGINILEEVQKRENPLKYLTTYVSALFSKEDTTLEEVIEICMIAFKRQKEQDPTTVLGVAETFLFRLLSRVGQNEQYSLLVEELFVMFSPLILGDIRTVSISLFFDAIKTVNTHKFSSVIEKLLLPHCRELVQYTTIEQEIEMIISRNRDYFVHQLPMFLKKFTEVIVQSGRPLTATMRIIMYQIGEERHAKLDLAPSQIATLKMHRQT